MKISACVIVKNEEKNLPIWLANMQQLADELIVVDTGSTDNSQAIAAAGGAKVYDFCWCNDFAAAKNYALEQARGEWIVFLDADEYFAQETIRQLPQVLKQCTKDKSIAMIWCRLINIDCDDNNRIIDTMLQARVFRNDPAIRFTGKIHERLMNTKGDKKMIVRDNLVIFHTGYSRSIFLRKAQRNYGLLQEQMHQAATQAEKDLLMPYLADNYMALGRYTEVIQCARRAIAADIKLIGEEGHFHELIFSALQRLGRPLSEQIAILDEAVALYPGEASFVFEKGYVLWQNKQYLESEALLQQGLQLRQDFQAELARGKVTSDNSLRLLPSVYLALGDIYYHKGDKVEAATSFIQGLNIHKYNVSLLHALYRCVKDLPAVEIIQIFQRIYKRPDDNAFLQESLQGIWALQLARYYGQSIQPEEYANQFLEEAMYDKAESIAANLVAEVAVEVTKMCIDDSAEGACKGILNTLLPYKYQLLLQEGDE